jgi:hypothetical protein
MFRNIEYLNKRVPRHDTSHLTPSGGNIDICELLEPNLCAADASNSQKGLQTIVYIQLHVNAETGLVKVK